MKARTLLLVMLVIISMSAMITPVAANPGNANASTALPESKTKSKSNEPINTKYLGYSVDGRTSASVLAAQRSHTVPGKQERNFAIFTGIVVILIVIFFSQIKLNN